MFDMTSIGKTISRLRKEKDLTQVELADQLGISYQAVSNWERGDSMPDISKLSELAEIFDISIDELLGHSKQTEVIKEIIDEKNVVAKDLDGETLEDVIPLVKPKQLDKNVDFSNLSIKQMVSVAPFMDQELLDQSILEIMDDIKIREITGVAPFLSTSVINQIVLTAFAKEDFKVRDITSIMPFVDREIIDALSTKVPEKELSALAPFMSKEAVSEIVQNAISEGRLSDVMGLLPFTEKSFFNKDNIKNIFRKK